MSARIVALLALADEAPEVEELLPYLEDADAVVRKTALQVLSEATDDWSEASPLVAAGLLDEDADVRAVAGALLAELKEVLVCGPDFAAALREGLTHDDPVARQAALGALWRHRLCLVADALAALADTSGTVRREAVQALVSLDDLDGLAAAAGDADPLVRQSVAAGIGAVGDPRGLATLATLARDESLFVRAAAFSAMAVVGCDEQAAIAAIDHPSWQVRQGAAQALAAGSDQAVPTLITALADDNIDVRKAAVRSLARWSALPAVRTALTTIRADADADVRAWARLALETDH